MQEHREFVGFFSYSHYDAETDPAVVKAFTTALEKRVNANLTNARFEIWRDVNRLRTGEKWNERLEAELHKSDILIALLTPRWIESDFCRKEYSIFEAAETGRGAGDYYILPILARSLDKQEKYFTPDQAGIYAKLQQRQYKHALVSEFLALSGPRRTKLIDDLADDIESIIDRLRLPPRVPQPAGRERARGRPAKEFNAAAHNFENVGFVKNVEVVLDRDANGKERGVYAQVDFFERLYLQGERGRIDFGVRRAFLSVGKDGQGELSKTADLKAGADTQNVYYVPLRDAPDDVSICIDPQPGRATLADLSLPLAAKGENYLSKIAEVTGDVKVDQLKAELILLLSVEGLHLADEKSSTLPRVQKKIEAIMDIAVAKNSAAKDQSTLAKGQLRRKLPVRER